MIMREKNMNLGKINIFFKYFLGFVFLEDNR